jgi:hypothetical protein
VSYYLASYDKKNIIRAKNINLNVIIVALKGFMDHGLKKKTAG